MKSIKSVSIIGMGALGLLYGSYFSQMPEAASVSFVMDEERFKKNQNLIFTVNGVNFEPQMVSDINAKPADLVIVAVKYTSLASALTTMAKSVDEHTIIMSVMNGITTEAIIQEHFPNARVIYTIAQGMDAQKYGNALKYTKTGKLLVGTVNNKNEDALEEVIGFLEKTGIPYVHEKDIMYRMWVKFMLNVGINQVSFVFNKSYRVIDEDSEANRILIAAMREVEVLGQTEGIPLTEKDLNFCLDLERSLDPDAMPSMGQDRINMKHSEVELFAGTVIRLAEKHNIPVPANRYIYKRVYEIESEFE